MPLICSPSQPSTSPGASSLVATIMAWSSWTSLQPARRQKDEREERDPAADDEIPEDRVFAGIDVMPLLGLLSRKKKGQANAVQHVADRDKGVRGEHRPHHRAVGVRVVAHVES